MVKKLLPYVPSKWQPITTWTGG